jgi:RNA polymerase sigma-70 factor (ECF subfamily)
MLLAEHPVGADPHTFALLALMHSHLARLSSRVDGTGGLLLLEEQDRSRWDVQHVRVGTQWLARSADGDTFSRFCAEAAIAAEHCFAPTFRETRWREIVELYAMGRRGACRRARLVRLAADRRKPRRIGDDRRPREGSARRGW